MRVTNEPGDAGASGPFAELLRLQTEFQSRLAEETVRYLRLLQSVFAPATPGTVVVPGAAGALRATAPAGGRAELALEVENRQRAHCAVSPQLTPLVSRTGVTWFPALPTGPLLRLVAPDAVVPLALQLPVPDELPAGTYHGALILQGFRGGALPLQVEVTSSLTPETPETPPRPGRGTTARRRGRT